MAFRDGLVGLAVAQVLVKTASEVEVSLKGTGSHVLIGVDDDDGIVVLELEHGMVVVVGNVGGPRLGEALASAHELGFEVGHCLLHLRGCLLELEVGLDV